MNKAIRKAVIIVGSQFKLANACDVSQQSVNKWLKGGGIDSKYLLRIERATNGEVTIRDICEEIDKREEKNE